MSDPILKENPLAADDKTPDQSNAEVRKLLSLGGS